MFDYEEFYDYYKCEAKNDIRLKDFFVAQNYQFGKADFNDYLYQMDNIYNQLVTYYLEDSNGRNWYDNEDFCKKPIFNGYTGFLNCIEMLSKDYIVNVHTLNHDLFFERLNNTEWINGKLCDGFEELGSPFYGKLLQHNRTYMCRLSRYTGKYNEKIRLYKLHGSIDNYVYCTDKGVSIKGRVLAPDTYIKTRCGIGNADFYKEVRNEDGTLKYENCPVNYHSDFLTGITSKISRYKEPLLYEKLFKLFKKNLNEAEILIVIGYGFKDAEINHYILSEFGTQKQCFVINPYADDNFKKLITEIGINEILIEKQIENLSLSDIGFMKHL